MSDGSDAEPNGASPSSTGPAGAHFEGQIGAHYLLTVLAGAEPRGFPGMSIERVEFQRAGEQHPLDDVILRGILPTGEPAVLEVQSISSPRHTGRSTSVMSDTSSPWRRHILPSKLPGLIRKCCDGRGRSALLRSSLSG